MLPQQLLHIQEALKFQPLRVLFFVKRIVCLLFHLSFAIVIVVESKYIGEYPKIITPPTISFDNISSISGKIIRGKLNRAVKIIHGKINSFCLLVSFFIDSL